MLKKRIAEEDEICTNIIADSVERTGQCLPKMGTAGSEARGEGVLFYGGLPLTRKPTVKKLVAATALW